MPEDQELPFPALPFSSGRTHHELMLIEVGATAAPIPQGRRVGLYHLGLKVGDSDENCVRRSPPCGPTTSPSSAPATTE